MQDDIDYAAPDERLRPLSEILLTDPRHENISIERWYEAVSSAELNPSAPKKVKQMFENAKMGAVYTYFAYRANQGVRMLAYAALEKALRIKYEIERHSMEQHSKPRNLYDVMNIALAQGWITNAGYRSSHGLAHHRAQMKLLYRDINDGLVADQPVEVQEPTHEQVMAELDEMDVARTRLHAGRGVRNILMHDDAGVSGGALATLELIAEEINQLFPLPDHQKDKQSQGRTA